MKIFLYRSWDEMRHLHAEWNCLLARSSGNTIFLTWEWCEAWWNAYGNARPLLILTAWEGKSLVGVVPLYADRQRRWARQWTSLRIIGDGSGDSDYLDFFSERHKEHEVISTSLQFLGSQLGGWDWIEIAG